MKVLLSWSETYDFKKIIDADSIEHAIKLFESGSVEPPEPSEGTYADGCDILHYDFIEEANDPVTGVKNGY